MTAKYIADSPVYETVRPYVMKKKTPQGIRRSNVSSTHHPDIVVRNVRGHETVFQLDVHGFAFASLPTPENLDNKESIQREKHVVVDFLKHLLGTADVRVFEHKVGTLTELLSQCKQ